MSDLEMIRRLLVACKAYHEALDMAMAGLVGAGRDFKPSRSPMWPAMVMGHTLITEIETELEGRT